MVLALCMLLAAIPATAEDDASGRWYLVVMGLTTVTFDLNEDGTCSITVSSDGGEENLEGKWNQDGAKVSIEVDDDTLPLTVDGDSLQFDAEGIAALGLDIPVGADTDLSVLSDLMRISREPGKVTVDEFAAYQEDGTLPEGVTEADMADVMTEIMSAFMLLMDSVPSDTGDSWSESGESALELTVAEDNFYVRDSYDTKEGVYFARLQNDNDVPAYLSDGSMTMLDKDGNEVGKAEYLGTTGSRYLEPGEATFVSFWAEVNEGAEVDHYTVNLQANTITYQTPDVNLEVPASELRVEDGYYTVYYGTAAVTNTAETPQANIRAVIAVRDSEGKLVDLQSTGLYMNELGAGSTIILVESVDSRASEYVTGSGLSMGGTEALAWIDTY